MKAWYFSGEDKKLRYGDNRIIEVGCTHIIEGKPVLCSNGLHGSKRVIDALLYAPGAYIWRVDITGNVVEGEDKLCGQRRKYLWGFDASDILFEFSRKQALINIEKIRPYTDKYDLIVRFLETGDKSIQSAARAAARAATWSAARAATWSAARAATWSATWAATWSARAAARAAESAARAAESATWAARAAESATWAAESATRAARAAESAARAAVRAAADKDLERILSNEAVRLGFI